MDCDILNLTAMLSVILKSFRIGYFFFCFLHIPGAVRENVPGFASAWDLQNLDLPDFRIFWPPKVSSTCSKQPKEYGADVFEGRIYSSSVQ